MKTKQNNYKKNISIFQRSTGSSMLVGAFFIIMNNVLEPESRLADIGEGLKTIFIQHHFTFKALILTTINYFLIYMVVYSLFNYLNYKKAIARIKERMVLEF